MPKIQWIAIFFLGAVSPCQSEELLFAAQVQQVTLTPDGVGSCEAACRSTPPDKNGIQQVCISNSPGCEVAEVKVLKNYLGEANNVMVFRARIGEWEKLHIPVRKTPILMYVVNGKTSWAPLVERGWETYFDSTSMRSIGSVDLRKLPKDKEGMVLLDVLIEHIQANKQQRQRGNATN